MIMKFNLMIAAGADKSETRQERIAAMRQL